LPGWAPFDRTVGLPLWRSSADDCPTRVELGACNAVLSLGGAGESLGLHFHHDAWLRILYGEKYWLLSPGSEVPPPGFHQKDTVATIRANWHAAHLKSPHVKKAWLECVQQAGDVLYIPQGWYHGVVNLGETLAIGKQTENVDGWFAKVLSLSNMPRSAEEERAQLGLASALVEELPGLFKVWQKLVILMVRAHPNDAVDMIETLAGAIESNPRIPEFHLLLAKFLLDVGEGDAATDSFANAETLVGKLGWHVQYDFIPSLYENARRQLHKGHGKEL